MEPEPSAPRKIKFAPKVPTRRQPKPEPKTEDDVKRQVDSAQATELMRKIHESAGRGRPKVEKKGAPVQVAFGQVGTSSFIRTYGSRKRSASMSQGVPSGGGSDPSGARAVKEYKEPWSYYSYYPVSVPVRRPYSGNPVVLDEEEFGESSETITYDENSMNASEELGLTVNTEEERMLFLQLPASLPLEKRSATNKGCSLEELPPGLMGKLLVYKSGMVKLRLGDMLYNVSPGSECVFAQDVLAVNTEKKHCCVLGELQKRAIVTPDVDSLFSAVADLQ